MKNVFFLFALLSIPSFLFSQWNWQNPYPNYNTLNAIKFTDVNNGFAVSNSGIIIKTVNGGTNWVQQKSWTFENLNDIYLLNTTTGYISGNNGKIIKTTNAGTNWSILASQSFASFYAVSFPTVDTGYAAGTGGNILRTTNAGLNWTSLASGTSQILRSIYFANGRTGWAAGYSGTILKTINAGLNWTVQTTGSAANFNSMSFIDVNTGWVAGNTGTVYKTINSGLNWTLQPCGITANINSINFTNTLTGTAVSSAGNIVRTTSGGASWYTQTSGTALSLNSVYYTDINNGWAGGDAFLKTTNGGASWTSIKNVSSTKNLYGLYVLNANTAWATGDTGAVIRTTNAGLNWTAYSAGTNQTLHTVYFIDANTGWAASRYGGVILKTINGGINWTAQNSGSTSYQFFAIHFIDANKGWAVGPISNVKTTNGGTNWVPETGANAFCFNVQFFDANTGIIVHGQPLGTSGIFKTTNGGVNWVQSPTAGPYWAYNSHFINANTGWITGYNDTEIPYYTMLKTTNSGATWTASNGSLGTGYGFVRFADENTGFTTLQGQFLRTTNGGNNWLGRISGTGVGISNMRFASGTTGWMVGSNGTILQGDEPYIDRSGYKSNLNITIPSFSSIYDSIYINAIGNPPITTLNYELDTILYSPDSNLVFTLIHAGVYDTLIYKAGGTGSNFVRTKLSDSVGYFVNNATAPFTGTYRPYRPLSQFMGKPVNGLWILRINSIGTIMRTGVIKSWSITITYNTFETSIKKIYNFIPDEYKLYQNFPNPFNPETKIKFDVKKTGLVKLKVYDILGREAAKLIDGIQSAGSYEITFNGKNLSSGIYFYKFEAGSYSETKKMILVK